VLLKSVSLLLRKDLMSLRSLRMQKKTTVHCSRLDCKDRATCIRDIPLRKLGNTIGPTFPFCSHASIFMIRWKRLGSASIVDYHKTSLMSVRAFLEREERCQ